MNLSTYNTPQLVKMLGERFKNYRIRLGMTQQDIAENTGLCIATIHKFEAGTAYNVSLATLFRLLKSIEYTEGLDGILPELPENPYITNKSKKPQRVKHTQNGK